MLAVTRRSRLSELVQQAGAVTTEDLAHALDVSTETIRRDLLVLDRQGLLRRVHGGAAASGAAVSEIEASFDERASAGPDVKKRIARAAVAMIAPGSTIMLDVGTTALMVARELPRTLEVTVATNSLRVAGELADAPGVTVLVCGGAVRAGDLALSNGTSMSFFESIYFDMAFLGSGGLDSEAGLTDYWLDEAAVRKIVIGNTRRSYVLADASKFDRVAPYRVERFDAVSGVIVDAPPSGSLARALAKAGADVVVAD